MLDYLAELRGGVDRRVRDGAGGALRRRSSTARCSELSTGNRQKLGLIQAFMHEPELLILDEPIAGLDPLVQQSFHALLGEVAAAGPDGVPLLAHAVRGRAGRRPRRDPARGPAGRRRLAREPARDRRPAARDRVRRGAARRPSELRALPGVREATLRRAHMLIVAFEGSADPLVKAIAAYEVRVDPQPRRRPRGDLPALLPRRSDGVSAPTFALARAAAAALDALLDRARHGRGDR